MREVLHANNSKSLLGLNKSTDKPSGTAFSNTFTYTCNKQRQHNVHGKQTG